MLRSSPTFDPRRHTMLHSTPVLSLVAAVALAAHGCTAVSSPPPPTKDAATVTSTPLPITSLLSSVTSGFAEPMEMVLHDNAALSDAWAKAHAGVQGNPAPAIDFHNQMVVVVALGTRRTGGYSVQIDQVNREKDGAVVSYTATSPGATCMTTQMITSPVSAVAAPSVTGTVRFERHDVVNKC
jgi:protease stability complex PrcB-like protein